MTAPHDAPGAAAPRQPWAARTTPACAACGTELAPGALACPACRALVHAATLRALAARAESATAAGALADARAAWVEALARLPAASQQAETIRARVAELDARLAPPNASAGGAHTGTAGVVPAERPWWRRAGASALGVLLLLLGKLKFLLLGLTKASTLFSMFAFFGLYWATYGWPLALGLVGAIYVHEMGHVAVLRRLGIGAGAPLFIPGVGAVVLLRQRIDDPRADAAVGLAGPVWGLGAGLAAYAAYLATGVPVWRAIAKLAGGLNLFNLLPVWQLDGARGFHALSRGERWAVVGAVAAAYVVTRQPLLLVVGAGAVWQAGWRPAGPGDRRTLATFGVLVAALSALAALPGPR